MLVRPSLAVENTVPAAKDDRTADPIRRRLMFDITAMAGAGVVLGAGLAPRRVAAATAKLAKTEIGYQVSPKGGQRCDLCLNWQPPGSCKLVAGPIVASGWCGLFQLKR